ncbi:MAG: hypothetical protein QNJ54_26275 [Prochloraceae cyanobacterium]|nr:hypothetical protein [Prochloraceae cyanobacterium]
MHNPNPTNTREQGGGCLVIGLMYLSTPFVTLFVAVLFSSSLGGVMALIVLLFCCIFVIRLGQIIAENIAAATTRRSSRISSNSQFFFPSSTRRYSSNLTQSPTYTVSPPNIPDDINNILENLAKGEIKDPVTQEAFTPGDKIYLCLSHRLAYHQDSWQEIGCKCISCNHSHHIKIYTLPVSLMGLDCNKKVF